MNKTVKQYSPWATGFAMFSMFFGAGNSVFPLAIGQYAQSHYLYAIAGMLITAVGIPFLGLFAMTLYNGNYRDFFKRTGTVPGFIVAAIILALIGPFGATPRCITLSYSTIQPYLPGGLGLPLFSLISCALIFVLTAKKNRLLDILGYVLTPVLLGSLAMIIFKGFLSAETPPVSELSKSAVFLHSLKEGYNTMDLMASFFFSSIVLACLQGHSSKEEKENPKKLLRLAMKSSLIGGGLLVLVYFGFCYVAGTHSASLEGIPKERLLGAVALNMLGPIGGIAASIAIAMACLTTALALVTVSAEFLRNDLSNKRIPYEWSLLIVLVITFLVSTLNFQGIARILGPILVVCYPALIVLSIVNLVHKLTTFRPVKVPVMLVFGASVLQFLAA